GEVNHAVGDAQDLRHALPPGHVDALVEVPRTAPNQPRIQKASLPAFARIARPQVGARERRIAAGIGRQMGGPLRRTANTRECMNDWGWPSAHAAHVDHGDSMDRHVFYLAEFAFTPRPW